MTDPAAWDGISVPGSDFNVRQVAEETPVPCFWGRDATGACLFIVELEGDHSKQFRANVVKVRGIDIDLRAEGAGRQRLVLSLDNQVDRDLFEGLCQTLATALGHATDSASALAVALAHVHRWKRFLSGRAQRLSAEEVRGLFAEICFLLELLDRGMPSSGATAAWLGPDRSHQDFIFGDVAVEIKSLTGTERSAVRISSEDQLESLKDELFLRIYRLSDLADADGSRSLNDLVELLRTRLDEANAADELDRKLAAYGYVPLPEYDEPHFVVSDVWSYRVGDGFPRLIRSVLPRGITKVAYDIKLEALARFKCDDEAVYGGW